MQHEGKAFKLFFCWEIFVSSISWYPYGTSTDCILYILTMLYMLRMRCTHIICKYTLGWLSLVNLEVLEWLLIIYKQMSSHFWPSCKHTAFQLRFYCWRNIFYCCAKVWRNSNINYEFWLHILGQNTPDFADCFFC